MANTKNVLRFIIIFQYLPRLYLIFPLSSQIVKATGVVTETAWAGAAYNLMLYMLASHVNEFWSPFSVDASFYAKIVLYCPRYLQIRMRKILFFFIFLLQYPNENTWFIFVVTVQDLDTYFLFWSNRPYKLVPWGTPCQAQKHAYRVNFCSLFYSTSLSSLISMWDFP